MSLNKYETLIQEFGPVKWIPKQILNWPNEGWFLIETTPCPNKDEIDLVVADIINDNSITVRNGKLYHSNSCTTNNHEISEDILRVIQDIKEETFLVAVYPGYQGYPGYPGLLNGQPIAIALNPAINYSVYPDHPHINTGGLVRLYNSTIVQLPPSLCYGYNKQDYNGTEEEKLYEVFAQVSIWLFRHQVWCATRNLIGKGIWIGRHETGLPPECYPNSINPLGKCRCGSGKGYCNCHMPFDYSELYKQPIEEVQRIIKNKIINFEDNWIKRVLVPEQKQRRALSESLISKG